MLEVSKHNNVCVASNVPEFYKENGELDIEDLRCHVKSKLSSKYFCGYTMISVIDSEDQITSLNISPYAFSKRLILYKPENLDLLEMCALISMIENMSIPSLKKCSSIQHRINFLNSKCFSKDSIFLANGARMLLSTIVRYHDIVSEFHMFWRDSLPVYKIHKEFNKNDTEASPLLIKLYSTSSRLDSITEHSNELKTAKLCNFKLFYLNTILSKHYESKGVIGLFRKKCMDGEYVICIFN